MKIADDFDAIRQRAREIEQERNPVTVMTCADIETCIDAAKGLFVDNEADVSSNYFGGPFFGGMIVA